MGKPKKKETWGTHTKQKKQQMKTEKKSTRTNEKHKKWTRRNKR